MVTRIQFRNYNFMSCHGSKTTPMGYWNFLHVAFSTPFVCICISIFLNLYDCVTEVINKLKRVGWYAILLDHPKRIFKFPTFVRSYSTCINYDDRCYPFFSKIPQGGPAWRHAKPPLNEIWNFFPVRRLNCPPSLINLLL